MEEQRVKNLNEDAQNVSVVTRSQAVTSEKSLSDKNVEMTDLWSADPAEEEPVVPLPSSQPEH